MSNNPLAQFQRKRVAIVHEWLVDYSGSERVVEQLLNLFPHADLFAVVDFLPESLRSFIQNKPVRTTFLQRLPQARKRYRSYLPLMPLAIEQLDLRGYDLVISSSHCVAKGVITGPDQLHICYCHSPMRYAWDLTHQYLQESGLTSGTKSWLTRLLLHQLRMWDYRSASGVDHFVANSRFIARRIEKVYRRESSVIHPPVDTTSFTPKERRESFYLTASRFVPYKRIDLIVQAFAQMPDRSIVVIGDGPDFRKVQAVAPPNVTLLGFQPFEVLRDHMQRSRAFLFAAEEDFGITPVEAQACGTPVIAYGRGGALDSVCDGKTGLFFDVQSPDSVCAAVERFEREFSNLQSDSICRWAGRFSIAAFQAAFSKLVLEQWEQFERRYERTRMPEFQASTGGRRIEIRRAAEETTMAENYHG